MYKEIEDILDEFDFDKVAKVMEALNWTWRFEPEPPTRGELRRQARDLLQRVYKMPELAETSTGTGGFEASRHMYVGDTKKYLAIKFIVSEWNNYES